MTTLPRLLSKLLALCFLACSGQALAKQTCSREFEVVKNEKGSGYRYERALLKNLYCGDKFEGPNFKVVEGVSNEAVSFDAPEELRKRAATVYFYVNEARTFWIEKIGSQTAKDLPQIVLRLNMKWPFSSTRHYLENEDEIYNNARSIPAGSTPRFVPEDKKKKWGREIWFRPFKMVDVAEMIDPDNIGGNPVTGALRYVERPIVDMAESNVIYEGLEFVVRPEYADQTPEMILLSNLLTIGGMKGITYASKYLDYVFVEDEFYIDSALVPEVIHHEFAHILLSDHLEPSHSRPVIEGMADYFVAAAMNKPEIYEKMDDIYLASSKDAENETFYHPVMELNTLADKDFTLSVIWKVRKKLEKLNETRFFQGKRPMVNVDKMVYQARTYLSASSQITDLADAMVKSCQRMCANRRAGLGAIRAALEEKGFN